MIVTIPLTMLVLMVGLSILQYNHYQFLKEKEQVAKAVLGIGEIDKFRKEFEDYKKRVDVLTIKAGFKL